MDGSHMLGKYGDLSLRSHSQYRFIQPIMRLRHTARGKERRRLADERRVASSRIHSIRDWKQDRRKTLVGRALFGNQRAHP